MSEWVTTDQDRQIIQLEDVIRDSRILQAVGSSHDGLGINHGSLRLLASSSRRSRDEGETPPQEVHWRPGLNALPPWSLLIVSPLGKLFLASL